VTTLERIVQRLRREGLAVGEAVPGEALDAVIRDVTTDSRYVSPGSLFCAIRGTAGDGHRFLPEARARGAAAALVEHRDASLPLAQVEVEDTRRAAAFAAAELYRDPWDRLRMVGVTGTNGKTTSVAILRHVLSSAGSAASVGTLGAVGPDGAVIPGSEALTTPGPSEVARWLAELADRGVQAVAIEVSSHALDQARVAAVRFDAAIFTNLSRDHLDYHAGLEEYRAAKLRLIDLLKPDGVLVLNADDPAWAAVRAPGVRTVRFGIDRPADVAAEGVAFTRGAMAWTLRTPDGSAPVLLPLVGAFNVANALGAAAALWGLGWETGRIAAALAELPQVPGRLERVPVAEGAPGVMIDYAHTPDALERALATLRPLVPGRLIVVFGAGGDRDLGKRPEMGRVAAELADLSVVTTDNPRFEDPERIADDIERGMGRAQRLRVLDRREAIRHALEAGGPDDLVLLAGKGHETYQIWGDERRPFDERVVVQEILSGGRY
jgi:UDP-N-acetylmuramoyl-L-alanyl-D-glutamate--2,6-diaminopimelate ligase